ncbi:hypothetical protein O8B93_26170 [Agrobacterium rhizogenes]|uniref:hypothetical protein n=1 Tax=Rhizobium rhizogenes TaxID=359 RepID=UPI0022B74659|nr:hypothetical protein [Rhizobium rhizogenes]MCZ7451059.1 hypothetical protein [Rhizobium rhizogenes]
MNGTMGKGGNGGLLSDTTLRAAHEVHAILSQPDHRHADDIAVDQFAEAMKAKMTRKRAEGRSGWADKTLCTQADLSAMLESHVRKGHPVDVANFAMMLHARGENIVIDVAASFESADWYWRTMDPDDSGDYPADAINRAGLGNYCVAEIACSFTGPRRFGFTAPVLDPESDDEEFLHFARQEQAIEAASARRAIIEAREAAIEETESAA